jgi:hypothetical protein
MDCIMCKFLFYSERAYDQRLSAKFLYHLVTEFQFLYCLPQPEALKQRPPAATKRPDNAIPLMRL